MSDAINSLTVVLERDMRDEDVDALIAAIKQLRGVASVSGNVVDINAHVAETRAKQEIYLKLLRVVYPERF